MKRKRSAVLVVVVMVAPMILPMVAGQSLRFPNSTDFGVHAEVAELLQRIEERRTGIDIVQQTEGVLHQIQEQPYDRITLVDSGEDSEDVRTVPFVQPASNEMVDSVLTTPIAGYDSIWDFLINNPLEYYVYYKYADEHHAWVEGSAINPTILPNDLDWTYLDVDDDPSTGTGGTDIRLRFKLEPREVHIGFTPTIIPPQDLFTLDLLGGLAFQVENLNPGPHATDAVPLEVGIAKSISFDGKNYIILLQFVFRDRIPDHYSLSLLMNMYLTDLTWEAIFALLSGNWTDIDVAIDKAVEGPYVIEWGPSTTYAGFFYSNVPEPFQSLIRALLEAAGVGAPGGGRYPPEDLPNLDIMAGIGNVTRAEDAFVWREISWLSAHVVPADGDDDGVRDRPFLPGLGNLTLDTRNENTAFESITWFYPENNQTFGYPTDVNVDYFDARDNESLYVRLDIEDMPYWLRLRLINESNDSEVRSRLLLDSSSEIGWLNYTEYLYTLDPGPFPQPVHPGNDFRVMHVELWDVPRHISLRGTFDSGSAPEPDIGGGNLITQFFNAVIAYFYKGFWGVGNTLRTISDRMFNMPADKGWFKLSMRGDHLGGVEFWYTTDRYVYLTPEKDGEVRDFVAFTRSRGESVDTPISGRVREIGDVKLFFGNDTTIDLEIDGQRAFYFTYIDQNATWEGHPGLVGYGEDATLRIASLPNVINITVTDRTLDIQTEGPRMGDVTFVGLINGTYMLLSMTDFPEGLSLYHFRDRFSLNFTGTLGSLEIAISDDSLARLPGRYILLRRTGTCTMISARITNVSSVMYDTRNGTRFAYELGASYPFYIRVNDTVMATDIRAAVNPLPKSIDLTLTAELGGEAIEVPSVGNISSIFDLSNVLVSLATMGDSVTKMLSNVTQGGLDILKDLGSNDRFDYSSSYNLNIVAEIKVGDVSHLGPVTWTHGVSMRREVIAGETVMHARIYLDGMPKILQLRTYIANDTTELNIAVEHFASRYSWVLLDVEGLMDRDI
ncbi:MAG TPA: hypothetical protein EYP43_00240, partial [Thermoplasmata archaeon]|nr:hypothetical protein [Thermoplasmata archaeon]